MTTTPDTLETPEPPDGQDPAEPTGSPDEPSESREAASYRRRLRETEAERDALAERVQLLERAEVERIAADHPLWMTSPSDLWLVGVTLDELRDGEGRLDPRLVTARVREVLAERPSWAKRIDMGQGARGAPATQEKQPGLSALLGKRK